jgi:hypothetical protein
MSRVRLADGSKTKQYNKEEEGGEISGKVYVCKNCKGVFIPESVFGVH